MKYSVKAISYAKQTDDLVALSRNYIKLANMFIRLEIYNIVEDLLKEFFLLSGK